MFPEFDSISQRIISNFRVYGVNATFRKSLRKIKVTKTPKQVSIQELVSNGINVHKSSKLMCEEYFGVDFQPYSDEADIWFNNWMRWQSTQDLEAPIEWNSGSNLLKFLFMVVRHMKPNIVVETGTANGASAAAISAALELNKNGILNTFDVYNFELCLVPIESRKYIQRHIISKLDSMEKFLSNLGEERKGTYLFFHDSNHSFEHQSWEYMLARKFNFDVLVSDDVDDSQAFLDYKSAKKIACTDGPKLIGIAEI